MTPFIVAELSKNWRNGYSVADTPVIAVQFEQCIEFNRQRGYRLLTFQLHRLITSIGEMNETIIAVFEESEHGERYAQHHDRPPHD